MKKLKFGVLIIAAAAMLAACSSGAGSAAGADTAAESTIAESTAAEVYQEAANSGSEEDTKAADANQTENADETSDDKVTLRVGSLKGPTSIGLLSLMKDSEEGLTENDYEFTMAVQADELSAGIVGGTLDIALLPANVASVLYNRTEGGVRAIDINTLGVVDVVSADTDIATFEDLRGKTIYITGKGTTPDYAFRYILSENGISEDEVDLEYKSESTEVAVLLQEEPGAIGVLPQPFVTSAIMQNPDLAIVFDLTEEWDKVQGEGGSRLVTGVTIVRSEILDEYPEAVASFVDDHRESAAFANANVDATAELVAAAGIIDNPEVAKAAIPYCNITCITGDDLKDALGGYLDVLFGQDAESVGGALPGDDFYAG